MKRDMREEILKGSIVGALLRLAWPVVLGSLIHTAYNLADTFWLGHLSKEALAAPTISWPIIWLVLSLSDGIAVAGTALVAQYTGAGNREMADRVAGQVLIFLLIVASVLSVIGVVLIGELLKWMGAEREVLERAASYCRIIFAGVPFIFGFFAFSGLLRGIGDTVTPMKIGAMSAALNAILDPFLIFGIGFFPRLEVSGAALATLLSRGVATATGIYLLFTGRVGLRVRPGYLRPDLRAFRKIAGIGVPSSLSSSGAALAFTLFMRIISVFGTDAISAHGVGTRVTSLLRMPIFGLGAATATMVGQNLGADRIDRARRAVWTAMGISTGAMCLGGVMCAALRGYLIRAFISEPEVVKLGSLFFLISPASLPFFSAYWIASSAFRGSGHTVYSMSMSLLHLWGLLSLIHI